MENESNDPGGGRKEDCGQDPANKTSDQETTNKMKRPSLNPFFGQERRFLLWVGVRIVGGKSSPPTPELACPLELNVRR